MSKKIEPLIMPKWGIEMDEGKLTEWLIDEGTTFSKGDPLVVIETDKISNEVEAEIDSTLRKKVVDADGTYAVGALLGIFASDDTSDEEIDEFINSYVAPDTSFKPESASSTDSNTPTPAVEANNKSSGKELPSSPPEDVNISPKAWEVALELDVDVSSVTPSGRRGRISVQDVEQAADPAKLAAYKGEDSSDTSQSDNPSKSIEHTSMRKVIAERLVSSKNTAPHFYLNVDLEVDTLMDKRASLNADNSEKISVNDLIIKCVATALKKHPEININWTDSAILQFENADISVAVATDAGLITPIIKNAGNLSVQEISSEMKRLSDLAHSNKLMPSDYQGGTFSISNLGMLGIKDFTAVINPPQCAILAVGGLQTKVDENDGKALFSKIISVTMSCDHRAIDGAVGARFLQTLSEIVKAAEGI
ncbi:MAG: dihydrolipoamide acetyltransferase family protein [Pseudomonadota bacterium]|nr:dihydrolipoamide acetyltransferase family protein [Pseudomonadota bacterium]